MATLDFNNSDLNMNHSNSDSSNDLANSQEIEDKTYDTQETTSNLNNAIGGLSELELSDPNNIEVTISDPDVPIVVLYGPTTCGKTMTLIRLTRFLKKRKYKISADRTFRPSYDKHYQKMCDEFNTNINSNNAAKGTNLISFMLVDVMTEKGKVVCKILEAPGEYYFSPYKPTEQYPAYVNKIISSSNRKIWLLMVEPNWQNEPDRDNYVDKIKELKRKMRTKDKTIFLFNKVDLTDYILSPGHVNMPQIKKYVTNMYQGMFIPFENQNPITRFFKHYNCELVAFSNGSFNTGINSLGQPILKYTEGADEYPQKLWCTIMKQITG